MFRFYDFIFSLLGIFLLIPVLFGLTVVGFIKLGSPIFCPERVGYRKKTFTLYKFRSMPTNTISVATHLLKMESISRYGLFLRRNKLDELPQLFNVLFGQMSLVGHRPNLSNQTELIIERDKLDVYSKKPGITGLAQMKNVDMSTPKELAFIDNYLNENLSIKLYFFCIFKILLGVGKGDSINLNK